MQRALVQRLVIQCGKPHYNKSEAYRQSIRAMATVKDIFPNKTNFPARHIGPRKTDVVSMLDLLGFKVKNSSYQLHLELIK